MQDRVLFLTLHRSASEWAPFLRIWIQQFKVRNSHDLVHAVAPRLLSVKGLNQWCFRIYLNSTTLMKPNPSQSCHYRVPNWPRVPSLLSFAPPLLCLLSFFNRLEAIMSPTLTPTDFHREGGRISGAGEERGWNVNLRLQSHLPLSLSLSPKIARVVVSLKIGPFLRQDYWISRPDGRVECPRHL